MHVFRKYRALAHSGHERDLKKKGTFEEENCPEITQDTGCVQSTVVPQT
jgi:hypothetical protein